MDRTRPRGRQAPPPIILDVPPPNTEGYRRAMDDDEEFFLKNPTITSRSRAYVPGETPTPFPPGTRVHVHRNGFYRVRSFEPGPVEGN